jgi:hypothetical protein
MVLIIVCLLLMNFIESPLRFQEFVGFLALQMDSIDHSVEGRTMRALHAQKVPGPCIFGPFTVIA